MNREEESMWVIVRIDKLIHEGDQIFWDYDYGIVVSLLYAMRSSMEHIS